ncbi:hypothetical protein EYF80_002466 [Liparis tanakae]|uniref:Uncharacterized protein n=1 Tax=Liparis tanakae TaxID=230148 RepID=A0A4Z2JBQ7_9TELE|nr:hypothetical protein EYF80_002466 [Liparis tanakae]
MAGLEPLTGFCRVMTSVKVAAGRRVDADKKLHSVILDKQRDVLPVSSGQISILDGHDLLLVHAVLQNNIVFQSQGMCLAEEPQEDESFLRRH